MKNIMTNKFWWVARSFASLVIFGSFAMSQSLLISEIAEGSGDNKYIEIYNGTGADVDLADFALSNCNNGCDAEGIFDYPNTVTFDAGTILPAGGVYVVCHPEADDFIQSECDGTHQYLSNGDDFYALVNALDGTVIDKVGDFGDDPGSGWSVAGVNNATKDHTLVRKIGISEGNTDWALSASDNPEDSEWWVREQNDWDFLGHHGLPFELIPAAGALKVGNEGPGSSNWWSNSDTDVDSRGCLFDDLYIVHTDGSFENVQGDETWVEAWQGNVNADGNGQESCAAPVAPHDGSADASWSFSSTSADGFPSHLNIHGVGAYLGIPKASNGSELSSPSDAPDSLSYELISVSDSMLVVTIGYGDNRYWTFTMVSPLYEAPSVETVDITFNLDMSSQENINPDGISVAGGSLFGGPGDYQMSDEDGDDIYSITISKEANGSSHYTFLNGVSDWGQKENIGGQECADPGNYNDRYLEWGTDDVTVNACFALCGDGTCADLVPPSTVAVFFSVFVDTAEYGMVDTVWATGSFEGWSGRGVPLTDESGNSIYTGVYDIVENSGEVEFKYTLGSWDSGESGADLGSFCDWNPNDGYNNYGFYAGSGDVHLPVYYFGGGCDVWESSLVGRPWMVGNHPGSMRVGSSLGSGEWWSNDAASLDIRACFFDDLYFFEPNGNFGMGLGEDTWVEEWQDLIGYDSCRAPVAPYDGEFDLDPGYSFGEIQLGDDYYQTVTLHGAGAYVGLPKAFNGGEYPDPANPPESITYVLDHYHPDSALFAVDISENQDGTAWWSFEMAREPEPTPVVFWLDAYSVPCDGNPYLAGEFNGWNATELEMEYDPYWDEYFIEIHLEPGAYQYKFACYDWAISEDMPAACSDPIDDGYNNRYIEVPVVESGDYYETDVARWGTCPPPDPCELFDCNNLHLVHFMEDSLIDISMDYLMNNQGMTSDSAYGVIESGGIDMFVWEFSHENGENGPHYSSTFVPEYSEAGDSSFVYIAEYPNGIPDSMITYYWVAGYHPDGITIGDSLNFNLFAYEMIDDPDASCVAEAHEFGMMSRYWDPSEYEEELYLLAIGDDDSHPSDIWGFDTWNSCEYFWNNDGDDDDGDDIVFLGEFNGREYHAVESRMYWFEAEGYANMNGGHLATINTPGENEFLLNALQNNGLDITRWIGLRDFDENGSSWGWVTGEPLGYTNWAEFEPNGGGEENCGEFFGEWNDLYCFDSLRSIIEIPVGTPPGDPVMVNYSFELSSSSALYNEGDTVSVSELHIDDGIHLTAEFDTSEEGPYMGLAVIHFDSNLNGVLDSNDHNILSGEWFYDQYGNVNYDDEVFIVQDNGPADLNSAVGVFEADIWANDDGNQFLQIQGATYFFSSIDTNYAISQTSTVSPYSGSDRRVHGHVSAMDDSTENIPGIILSLWTSTYDGGYREYHGISQLNGHYDIGTGDHDYGGLYHSWQQRNQSDGRLSIIFWRPHDYDYYHEGFWSTDVYWMDGVPEGGVFVPTRGVRMNTLISGQILDPDGNPVTDQWLDLETNVGDEYNSVNIWNNTHSDSAGHYSIWSMNGSEVTMWSHAQGFEHYDTSFVLFTELYDDGIDGYRYTHNVEYEPIDPGMPTQLIRNGSFEDYFGHWQIHPADAGNFAIDSTGSNVHNSEATIEAYDGHHVLKMWGGYHSDGFNVTDVFQEQYEIIDSYNGGTITVSAMMMSHADDWIGDTSHAATSRANVFIAWWDYDWNLIHVDVSDPLDASDAPSEWHLKELTADIVPGAYRVNIGVSYVQNDWSHGSVYFDHVQSTVGEAFVNTATIVGYVFGQAYDEEFNYWYDEPIANAPVDVYSDLNYYQVLTNQYGRYEVQVAPRAEYFISGPDLPGLFTYDYHYVYVNPHDYIGDFNLHYMAYESQYYDINGHVVDLDGNPMSGVNVQINGVSDSSYFGSAFTDNNGFFSSNLPYGVYDLRVSLPGHYIVHVHDVEVFNHTMIEDVVLELVTAFDGSVQGVVTFTGNNPPDGVANVWLTSEDYQIQVQANEDGFFYADLLNGVYGMGVWAPGYMWTYVEDAFEISGNSITYNFEIFEFGYAGPPEVVDLHDIPNDQGRQMRAVWHTGTPGEWDYFTQFSIWRKVNGAAIDLWDYVETIPWHGVDPYAAVVPTLGDSSVHGMHMSTFMVTAHTEDVDFWLDSEPVSGYSIDNLHPSAPMSLMYSHDPGVVSLNWSGPQDEDFSHHNIYRQEIASNEPAMVFTTIDSFFVDADLVELGAYEYWVTAVDHSGLESDPSNSVSAVLSADEAPGLPTEFAINQNYPNPFNPSTQIQYALPEETKVVISIYDLMGRKVRTLVNDVQSAGYRNVMWNATNDMGRLVSAGVYIYSIQAGDFIQNRKMVLMK